MGWPQSQPVAHTKGLGLHPCRSPWEVSSGGVPRSGLCLKDCSSLWVEKGMGGGERERGAHQTLLSRMEIIVKGSGKEGVGT